MELNEYQEKAMTTCLPSSNNFAYMYFNFLGEVGELMEKVGEDIKDEAYGNVAELLLMFSALAKKIRKEPESVEARIAKAAFNGIFSPDKLEGIAMEIGDCAWQMNGMMTVLGLKSEDVHQKNLTKLFSRQKRNVIDGNGDNR